MTWQIDSASAEHSGLDVCHTESEDSIMVLKAWAAGCLDLEDTLVPRLQLERDEALELAAQWQVLSDKAEDQVQRLLGDREMLLGKLDAAVVSRDAWQETAAERAPTWLLWLTGGAALVLGAGVGVVASKVFLP